MKDLIRNYYKVRGLKWPTVEQAMMWAETELAEVYELLLARELGWVRNNPESHHSDNLAEELGDAIMMLIVAGIVEGVDPLQALRDKMERKIREIHLRNWSDEFATRMSLKLRVMEEE